MWIIRLGIQMILGSAAIYCVASGATTIGLLLMTIIFLIGIIWVPPGLNSSKDEGIV